MSGPTDFEPTLQSTTTILPSKQDQHGTPLTAVVVDTPVNKEQNTTLAASTSLPTPPVSEYISTPHAIPLPTPTATAAPVSDLRSDVEPVSAHAAAAASSVTVTDLEAIVGPAGVDSDPDEAEVEAALRPLTNGVNGNGVLTTPVTPAEALATAQSLPLASVPTPAEPVPAPYVAPVVLAAPVAADAIPPPPILPLPSHIEIPAPHLQRVDSTSSLNVEPPTPAPVSTFAPPPPTAAAALPQPTPLPLATPSYAAPIYQAPVASSSGQVYAPAAPMEDVVMGDAGVPREISPVMKRSAPGEEGIQGEAKRQKVEDVPGSFAALPPSVPSQILPVQGFDPTAFHNVPTPLPSTAPTMSPAELHTPVPSSSTAAAPLPLEPEAPQSEGPIAVFTKEQQKFAVSLLRTLKKHRSAPPFLRPVDPVALLIPDYFRVVTHPMDLGTVESKLGQTGKAMALAQKTGRIYGVDYGGLGAWEGKTHDVYRTAEEFREDVERVWENCFKYNGPKEKNPVSAMAGALQDVYERLWRNMPQAPAVEYKPEPARLPSPENIKKERRPSTSFVPTIRRSEDGPRPKREIHAPARELAYSDQQGGEGSGKSRHGRVSGKAAQEQLRFCKEVMREMLKKVHEPYAYVFYEPVNYVALNIPQYPSIVKKPIDLGTIRQKLEGGQYPVPPFPAFEADMRLLFKNCYLFNPPGTPVNEWGQKLEEVFSRKWDERPTGDDDDDMSDDEISTLERQVAGLQHRISELKAARAAAKAAARQAERAARPPKPVKKPSHSEVSRNKSAMANIAKGRSRGSGGGMKKKKMKRNEWSDEEEEEEEMQMESEVVTFDMKRELAVKIVAFEGENLEKAIDIIRRGRPELLGDANKEIELDIDQLDQRTLLALYRFVCPPSPSRKSIKANRRPATGGTKRKNLDEIKESERIEMLEARLRDFENGAAAVGGTPVDSRRGSAAMGGDQASSDSSEEGSESDSESEDDD